jgi:hypothetical protein
MKRRIHPLTKIFNWEREIVPSLVLLLIELASDGSMKIRHLKYGDALAHINGLAMKETE